MNEWGVEYNEQERMPENFHVSTTFCAADYFSI